MDVSVVQVNVSLDMDVTDALVRRLSASASSAASQPLLSNCLTTHYIKRAGVRETVGRGLFEIPCKG